jgi:hypothetical protein
MGKIRELTIKQIDYHAAMDIVINKHYLHRKCPCSFAFGLYDNDNIVGVIVYGTPSSAPVRSGVCGIEHASDVIELNRLWIDDSVGHNGESYLIGNTIKLVNKPIILSYADTSMGHIGYVYQATNWIYTGLSAKRTNWFIEGIDIHNQSLTDKYSSAQLKELYGDKFKLVDRPRKHRYVYFNCDKRKKKELLKKLKYKIEPYPKKILNR